VADNPYRALKQPKPQLIVASLETQIETEKTAKENIGSRKIITYPKATREEAPQVDTTLSKGEQRCIEFKDKENEVPLMKVDSIAGKRLTSQREDDSEMDMGVIEWLKAEKNGSLS
ncbi:hypothetical protein ACH5RR_012547, partial [Cinchona calisaya]